MIPKKIHYCWFGNKPLPTITEKCIESWRNFCPDYEIICWNESNCNLNSNHFVREAYEAQKWAFVSDYVRLKVIEEHGGIYLDTDVELLRPLDKLLIHQGFMGFEMGSKHYVATGLGFGAIAWHPVITHLRSKYEEIHFINEDGSQNTTTCPIRDTSALIELGLTPNNIEQDIQGIQIYPSDYFSPVSALGQKNFTPNTHSIHHFNGSWLSIEQQRNINIRKAITQIFGAKIGIMIGLILTGLQSMRDDGISGFAKKIKVWLSG